jgi:DNA-binding transcriptional regulator YhcF (GntR family)
MAQPSSDRSPFTAPVLDRDGEVPIGVQLAWALRVRIGGGRFRAGERLPGVRELAEAVGVNVNTVRSVYQRLEREGLIESRHGTGTFVADTLGRSSAGELAAAVADQAREQGVDPREVAAALYVSAPRGEDQTAAAIQRRRELRSQIAALERALGELEARNPGLLPPPSAGAPRMAGPRLLSAGELEQVKDLLVRRLADAQLALDARAEAAAQPAVQSPVPTGRPARAKTPATVELATP